MSLLQNLRTTVSLGQSVENRAAGYLKSQGLKIVKQNYRCKGGEIDIVARDGEYLVFVEVRHRKSNQYGRPAETVTHKKQQRIILAARHYIQRQRTTPPCRFDVIESWPGDNSGVNFNWIKDAFTC